MQSAFDDGIRAGSAVRSGWLTPQSMIRSGRRQLVMDPAVPPGVDIERPLPGSCRDGALARGPNWMAGQG